MFANIIYQCMGTQKIKDTVSFTKMLSQISGTDKFFVLSSFHCSTFKATGAENLIGVNSFASFIKNKAEQFPDKAFASLQGYC